MSVVAASADEKRMQSRHSLVGPPHLWQMKRDFQLSFLKRVGLQPGHFLIDIGCGTLRGGIPIIQYLENCHYFGIESRGHVLEEGEKELLEAGLSSKMATLIQSDDLGSESLPRKVDYIWAFSVLIHMTDGVADDCVKFAARHLGDDGHFYANVNLGERRDGSWQGFPVASRSRAFYEELGSKHHFRVEDIGSLKSLGHQSGVAHQDNQRMLKLSKA